MGAAVQPIYLFDLAFQRSQWLTVRQSVVAENIANANTPNYRARDVEPFEATLEKSELAMAGSSSGHILPAIFPAADGGAKRPELGSRQPRQ